MRSADGADRAVTTWRLCLERSIHRDADRRQGIHQRVIEVEEQVHAYGVAGPPSENATRAFWSLAPVAITTNCLPDLVR
jgi:hypothetical protein